MSLNLSASLKLEGQLILSGSLTTTQVQYITSSNAITSSHSSYAQTASYLSVNNYNITSSWSNNSISSSYNVSSSYSLSSSFAPINTNITTSWSNNSLTASYYNGSVISSSYSLSTSYAPTDTNITSSWSINSVTASYMIGSISNAVSSSYAETASYMVGSISNAISSSYSLTSSYSLSSSYAPTNVTSSWSNNSISSSYAITSSYALNSIASFLTGSVYSITSSWSSNAVSASYNPNAFIQGGNSFGTLATLGTNDSQSLAFETNNNEWVRIDLVGNVGIGTTIPRGKLHVAGNITASSVTASLLGTSSWSNNSISSSYAITSSNATTSSYAPTNISYITSTVRIVIGASRSNANAFYFNAFTRTSDASAATSGDSAFLIPASGLTNVNVYLRQSGNTTIVTDIGVYRSTDGSDFSTATLLNNSSSKTITQHTVQTYSFTGLTLNANDCIYIYCKPAAGGSNYSGIVIVS